MYLSFPFLNFLISFLWATDKSIVKSCDVVKNRMFSSNYKLKWFVKRKILYYRDKGRRPVYPDVMKLPLENPSWFREENKTVYKSRAEWSETKRKSNDNISVIYWEWNRNMEKVYRWYKLCVWIGIDRDDRQRLSIAWCWDIEESDKEEEKYY